VGVVRAEVLRARAVDPDHAEVATTRPDRRHHCAHDLVLALQRGGTKARLLAEVLDYDRAVRLERVPGHLLRPRREHGAEHSAR